MSKSYKARTKSGKAFEAELLNTFRAYKQRLGDSFWFHRIPDSYDYARNWCPKCKKGFVNNFLSIRNPSDLVLVYDGEPIFVEAKSSISSRYRLEWVKPHQISSLIEIKRAGGHGFFFISYRASLMSKRHPTEVRIYDNNKMWAVSPEYLKGKVDEGTASLSWLEIASNGIEILRAGNVWEIDTLLRRVVETP